MESAYNYSRKYLSYFLFSLAVATSTTKSFAQFNYSLTGNPVNTTGWVLGNPTYVSGGNIVLNDPNMNLAGYIYYNQPVNLTGCAQFTVNFEFRVTNNALYAADGISFWYITTPPSGFVLGGGIGLPSNSTGLALFLDTYDNDGNVNNPLISVRSLNNSNYVEGSSAGLIGTDVLYQNYITDGTWHSCQMTYNNGNITVSVDGGAPIISGYYLLNMTGYFGFSASTGLYYSTHAIRNVSITGATVALPVANTPVTYCQDDAAVPLSATGTNLQWYTTPTGGTPLTTAPVPNTAVAGTTYWYVSQTIPGCGESGRDTVEVVVNPRPIAPQVNDVVYCRGQVSAPLTANGQNLIWYDTPIGGVGSITAPTPSTTAVGTTTYYVSQTVNGCESDRAGINVLVSNISASLTPLEEGICLGESVQLSVSSGYTYQWYDVNYNPAPELSCSDCAATKATPASAGDKIYYVSVSNTEGCKDTLASLIHVYNLPDINVAPKDTTITYGSSVTLVATGGISYWWEPGSTLDNPYIAAPVASPREQTRYIATGKNAFGCYNTDTCIVRIDYKNEVFIPSAFTPNGDGRNDVFKIFNLNFLKILEFRIFNRWGNEVFSTTDPARAWDGTYGNKPVETGVYFYSILLANPNGSAQSYKGDVTLVR